ncbi:HAD-IIB family hydrolase [Sphaerochaeta sp. UBA5849]|uniref:HAD-IIB family hydrolase n=1 Tax=Sphaerochaeta sp. UBA5849 TaxID=1947475 RepID=UPI0031F48920
MNRYKGMFVCDVDGTILPHGQREVSPSFFSLVHEAKERGFLFCISSGRFHLSLIPLFEQVEDEVVFSASNGCRILYQGQELIPNHTIHASDAKQITDFLLEQGAIPLLSGKNAIHLPSASLEQEQNKGYLAKGFTRTFEAFSDIDDEILQITGVCRRNKQDILVQSRRKWEDSYHVATTGKELFDICPTSKGDSLVAVSSHFGIPIEQTYAFGDDENDISMLMAAGKGYLMGGAHENLQKHAFEHCHDLVSTVHAIVLSQ